jgi:hypothetical protein
MAKPTTGRVEQHPEPDPDQMAADTLMTSVFTGISFMITATLLASIGSLGLFLMRSAVDTPTGAKVGFALGLLVGCLAIAWVLRRFGARLRARSQNLSRGAWIGSVAALVVLVFMAYLPQVAFPQYCPPGQICLNGRR